MTTPNAFTAGVKPGGLTNHTEIRLLLCYLIKNVENLTRNEIEYALMEEALVNYFEIASCLDDLLNQALVTCENEQFQITEKGSKVVAELAYDLPASVCNAAINAVIRKQTWNKKSAEYHADIKALSDGHYSITCKIKALPEEVFSLKLTMPDALTAQVVKENFILKGNEIYELLLTKLTDSNK